MAQVVRQALNARSKMSRKGPYLPWYPGDIMRDSALMSVSIGAFGLWHKLMYIAFDGTPYGHVSVKGGVIPPVNLARMVGLSLAELTPLIDELEHAGVFSRNADGVIFSRRMVRDSERSARATANGLAGGNPLLKKGAAPTRSRSNQDNPTLNQEPKGGVIPFPALCLLQYASASDNAGKGSGETTTQLRTPYTSIPFCQAWDAWVKFLNDSGRLYTSIDQAQSAIDLLKDFDEEYATQLLKLATVGRWQMFVFDDTRAKYERAKGGHTAPSRAKPSPTERSQSTVQSRGERPPTLKEHLAAKNA